MTGSLCGKRLVVFRTVCPVIESVLKPDSIIGRDQLGKTTSPKAVDVMAPL